MNQWYDWRAFGFDTQHVTNMHRRTTACGMAVPLDATFLSEAEQDEAKRCTDCVAHLEEPDRG